MTKTLPSLKYFITSFSFIMFITLLQQPVIAQGKKTVSRVAITVENNNTNIWISDFPNNSMVMLTDGENNLLGMITTNEFGAAYTSLPLPVTATVYAKTLNGLVNVSNKAVDKSGNKLIGHAETIIPIIATI